MDNNWDNFNPNEVRKNGVTVPSGRKDCALEQALRVLRLNIEYNVPKEHRGKITYTFTWEYEP